MQNYKIYSQSIETKTKFNDPFSSFFAPMEKMILEFQPLPDYNQISKTHSVEPFYSWKL